MIYIPTIVSRKSIILSISKMVIHVHRFGQLSNYGTQNAHNYLYIKKTVIGDFKVTIPVHFIAIENNV